MDKKFTEYSHFDLSAINKEVLKKWDDEQVFHKSLEIREGAPSFVFYEGPPSANGMPGIHHVMARSIKDIFCRYKTMKGFQVMRKAGWDTHGLPVELGVEKALGITKEDIGKKISVEEYNAACRKDVMKYTKEWEDLTHKMGYWVDMKNPYITYDNRYIETLWWLLKQLYGKGLLYKGYTIQPYSPAAGTGLSSHELNQPGCYRDVKDTTVVAQFKMKNPRPEMATWGTPYFIAWTTTPWTLPSNTALCVGPKIDYIAVRSYNSYTGEPITVVLAKALLNDHFNPKAAGLALDDNFVKTCIDVEKYTPYQGAWVKNAYDPRFTVDGKYDEKSAQAAESLDIIICMMMKQSNQAFKIEKHVHNYPHCWRTDKPVLYYPLDSWFIRSTACKERMIELNKTINWKPESTGTGRFGKWLENLNDWNLSRSRYWGTPLPIWRSEEGEEICIGSIEELYQEIEKSIAAGFMKTNPYKEKGFVPGVYTPENYGKIDLHRPYVDDIILVSKSGNPMKRESDLIDVWFDSGSMPYAQIHYPFENKELLDSGSVYPADFIAEGVDQTRGWFFTLHAIAAMIFDKVAYKTVISNGLVLDKNGNKMSKRLGNAVDPFSAIEKYGSDPLRWYMITNSSPWDNLKFDLDGVEEVRRKFFGTLYNTYSFFALYANVDGFTFAEPEIPVSQRPEIDRWIISLLNSLVKEVDGYYADYEPTRAGRAISDFVNDNLSNWYVRLNRKRFWGGNMDKDKLSAYQTLYTCLETVASLMAPIAPFFADRLYTDLTSATGRSAQSVHLSNFPAADESVIDKELEERMQDAQDITSMVLALRRKVNIKVRQPLTTLMIPVLDEKQQRDIETIKELVLNEVNVKEMLFADNAAGILVKRVKPDFKKLGPRYGKIMKQLAAKIAGMSQDDILQFEKEEKFAFDIDGQQAIIEIGDVEIISEDIPGWLVANEGRLTVALDITVTEDLRREGIARELVNRIQNIRKSSGFDITDKIHVKLTRNEETDPAVEEYKDYIAKQVLAESITLCDTLDAVGAELDFETFTIQAAITKA